MKSPRARTKSRERETVLSILEQPVRGVELRPVYKIRRPRKSRMQVGSQIARQCDSNAALPGQDWFLGAKRRNRPRLNRPLSTARFKWKLPETLWFLAL